MKNRQSSIVNHQSPKTVHLGFAKVDAHRHARRGIPEVIYGESKSAEHIIAIVRAIEQAGQNVLCTRISPEKAKAIQRKVKGLKYNALARTLMKTPYPPEKAPGKILVICAGTSDLSVAEEAAVTLEFLNDRIERICDVGVAGIHRLLEHSEAIQQASVIVCVAGMEGALPSVVAGLTRAPVIAVPTSVGYGAAFGGVTALLAMLNSCSGGVAVVNIDNGFGAAQLADQILRRQV
ncbi:MAG: nickel pincer cofactor biosynthesis protein LarB [Candidatus Sumerlaeota bacterium]|nr:nickel pincer cofactor biosynthesis protein LarB [Candidatus Sumerlaeota bacterium]